MTNRGHKTRHDGVFRKKDGAWTIRVVLREHGRFRSVARTLPPETPEAEVVAARARLRVEAERRRVQGTPIQVQSAARPTTVSDYAEQWMKRKRSDWRPKTREDNLEILAARILPRLGRVPVDELRRANVTEWRTWAEGQKTERGKPYAAGTLGLWWRVLRGMLRDLVADYELSPNLVFNVKPPRSDKPRVRAEGALTSDQLAKLLDMVKKLHKDAYAEVYTIAIAGCRPGELYALTWGDIDLVQGTMTISKSVVRGQTNKPKNGHTRIVALTPSMKAVLEAHKQEHPGLPGALVFPASNGKGRDATTLHHLLVACGRKVGIPFPVGPQILRYTANTLLRDSGAPDVVVRARLGHATAEMGHLYYKGGMDAQRVVVERVEAAVQEHVGR